MRPRDERILTLLAGLLFAGLLVGNLAAGQRTAAPVTVQPAKVLPQEARAPVMAQGTPTLPVAAPVVAIPTVPASPAAPVTVQPAAPPEVAHPVPFILAPPELPDAGPFHEEMSPREMPEIRLTDATGESGDSELICSGASGTFRLRVTRGLSVLRLPPDTYRYEFRSNLYHDTGQPDQVGTFTCRRFRVYSIPVVVSRFNSTQHGDLGD